MQEYKTVPNSKEILTEMKALLSVEEWAGKEDISILSLYQFLQQKEHQIKKIFEYGKDGFFFDGSDRKNIQINEIYYKEHLIKLMVTTSAPARSSTREIIWVEFQENDLFIRKIETDKPVETKDLTKNLSLIQKYLKKVLPDIRFYESWKNDKINIIKSTNSSFGILFDFDDGKLSVKKQNSLFTLYHSKADENFYIKAFLDEKFEYGCNSASLLDVLESFTPELLSQIYIPIEKCPETFQEELREIRNEQLQEKTKIKRRFFWFIKK